MKNMKKTFRAFRVEELSSGQFEASIQELTTSPLQEGELLIKVHYSSLNYKDALSATGNKGVTRNYPHTPGIDAAGVVEESASPLFKTGEQVIVTSYDLGMNTDGGFAEYIKVPADWAVKLPASLTMKEAMIFGTAGFTAGMSVLRLSEKINPSDGPIAVSGATGGVGAISVSILSKLGYSVTAITGKEAETPYLKQIGAKEVILRQDLENLDKRPLLKPTFAGAVDTVGGTILENIIKSTQALGTVTCCGNVASPKLDLTVFPFILRGVSLIGIDSQNYPMSERVKVWELLANEWKPSELEANCREIQLEEVSASIQQILAGKLKGRTVIKIAD
ncbi:YhdH/YhfP family quinone oxidoreductase [Carboxylicivirga taeanensis]|uniref:YhdH/YhfP family quinone oxidoreductase n=1 Tax=Carboxylicivirga taeanensis TaxID=1416875 RepID=UPI003F6DB5FB